MHKSKQMTYKVFSGVQEHITLTFCACASGELLPPMFTFKTSMPKGTDFHILGPENALYSTSESGHTDTDLYFDYIRHLEPFLCQTRPVIIFQDNLAAHKNYELVQLCVEKKFNFPSKVSHLIQSLDKLFRPFKLKLEQKKQEAMMLQQKYVAKDKIPIIARFAMAAMNREGIRSAFEKTDIYPLNRAAISSDLLVGDEVCHRSENADNTQLTCINDIYKPTLSLHDNDNEIQDTINCETHRSQQTQTEPLKSLPCSICFTNEVSLHPAVAAGVVDIELANVFLTDAPISVETAKKRSTSRDCSRGLY